MINALISFATTVLGPLPLDQLITVDQDIDFEERR